MIKLRVVTAFHNYRVGDLLDREPALARQMIAARWYGRKLVEPVTEPAPVAPVSPSSDLTPEPQRGRKKRLP